MDEQALIRRVAEETRRSRRAYARRVTAGRILLVAVLLGLWETASGTVLDPFFVSKPSAILQHLWSIAADGSLFHHLRYTLVEVLAGYAIGNAIALALAFALTVNRTVLDIVQPLLMALYAIPRVALAPLFVMWFGLGLAPKIAIAALLTFFIVFMNTVQGITSVGREFVDMAVLMGAGHRQIATKVVLPAAMPHILTSMQTTVPLAVLGAVLGEFLSANRGLGFVISQATAYFDTAAGFAGVLVLMVLTIALSSCIGWFETRVLRWRPRRSDPGKPGF